MKVASIGSAFDPGIRTQVGARSSAAIVGASLSGLAAGILHFAYDDGTWVAALGVPVGAIVGYLSAPRVISSTSPKLLALVLAVAAPIVGWGLVVAFLLIAGLGTAAAGAGGVMEGLAGVVLIALAGFIPSLMIGLPLTLPVSLVSVGVFRWLQRRAPTARFAVILGLLAATLTLAGLAVVDTRTREAREAARVGVYAEDHWLQRALAPVRLDWIVVNRSSQYLSMPIESPTGDGWSGTELPVIACATSAGRLAIGHGWRINKPVVDPFVDPEMNPFDLPPLVAEDDPSARNVTITIDIAPDGNVTVSRGGVLPTEDQLDQPLCQVEPMSRGSLSAASRRGRIEA